MAVSNFGLVENLEILFDSGLTVITGETGAGKSLLVGALGFLLGEKSSAELVRSGASKAMVEGNFIASDEAVGKILGDAGIETEEELILRRELGVDGTSRAFVNNRSVTVGFLRQLGDRLADFHGQHQHQSLLVPANHRDFFDRGVLSKESLAEIAEVYQCLKAKQAEWAAFCSQRKLSPEEAELLSFQLQEIKAAGLSDDEEEKLSAEKKVLENVERLQLAVQNVLGSLDEGEGSARIRISTALKELRRSENLDSNFAAWAKRLESIGADLGDVLGELDRYPSNLEASPERLAEVLDRLDLYQKLKRKYGGSVSAVLEFAAAAQQKLIAVSSQKSIEEKLLAELEKAEHAYLNLAQKLSRERKNSVTKLVAQFSVHLTSLALKDTIFEVCFGLKEAKDGLDFEGKKVAYDEAGFDQIEFFFSANPGEEVKPLAKTASGGELSRLMLALKLLSAGTDKVGSIVFDEIDQGLGGETAYRVGEKLLEASRHYQVLCITHLQQIAAQGNSHLLVSKERIGDRNIVAVKKLSNSERKTEIARMLAGSRAGEAAFKQAEEMLGAKPGSRRFVVPAKAAKSKNV